MSDFPAPSNATSQGTGIQSVVRALALLERLAQSPRGMRLSDLARAEGLAMGDAPKAAAITAARAEMELATA